MILQKVNYLTYYSYRTLQVLHYWEIYLQTNLKNLFLNNNHTTKFLIFLTTSITHYHHLSLGNGTYLSINSVITRYHRLGDDIDLSAMAPLERWHHRHIADDCNKCDRKLNKTNVYKLAKKKDLISLRMAANWTKIKKKILKGILTKTCYAILKKKTIL